MKREWVIFIIGVIIFFLPLLGFPIAFKTVVFMILGLLLWGSALRELRKAYRQERTIDSQVRPLNMGINSNVEGSK